VHPPDPRHPRAILYPMNTKFDKPTDQPHTIKLESKLLYAVWNCGVARGGAEVPFEVKTLFVGNGADIEISGKSSKGKAPGKIKGKIFNNHFTGNLPIPEKADPEAFVWFEAKLPKHSLKTESNEIPAAPAIVARKFQWDRTEARRGDVVKIQAQFDGVRGDEEAVVKIMEYDSDGNYDPIATIPAQLKGRDLQIDWEYQYHEDTDEIPTDEEMKKYGKKYNPPEYFFVVVIDGVRIGEKQESGLLRFKDYAEIVVNDPEGKPCANRKYTLVLADGSKKNGTLDAEGKALLSNVAPGKFEIEVEGIKSLRLKQEPK
jgi:hypothetical protein